MKTMREINCLLLDAIRNIMTDEQLDAKLHSGLTTRQIMGECALAYTTVSLDADAVKSRPAASASPIKAYWHPSGFISPRKMNAEWLPLVLKEPL